MLDHGDVDRSECPAERHDTLWDYQNRGCRCPDRRAEHLRYRKQGDAGVRAPRLVPSWRAARRLQALAAIGWTAEALAPELNMYVTVVRKLRSPLWRWVHERTFQAVDVVYERLCGTPGPSEALRDAARGYHWYPPLAWEDIDDEHERPRRGVGGRARPGSVVDMIAIRRVMHGESLHLTPTERALAVRLMAKQGRTHPFIAERLGITPRHVERMLARAREDGTA